VDERRARIEALGYDYDARDKEEVDACNLCGSRDSFDAARRDRYGFAATLRICPRCGLGFLSPRLTAAEYARFYEDTYRPLVSAYHGRRIDAETVQAEQRVYAAELVRFLRESLPAAPSSVIDIGGSTGVVAAAVRDAFGASATVLDPAPDELAQAATAGMETIAGFAEDFDPAGRSWDLVLLCQTIDHLLDVSGTLAAIRGMLADSGHAFVDVLDVVLVARREGALEGAVKIDHPFFLTRDTAGACFARAGLHPIAQRLSEDCHWGFVLRAGDPAEPDWGGLEDSARRMIEELA
jgi:SAM-dependent methyltransferase